MGATEIVLEVLLAGGMAISVTILYLVYKNMGRYTRELDSRLLAVMADRDGWREVAQRALQLLQSQTGLQSDDVQATLERVRSEGIAEGWHQAEGSPHLGKGTGVK